MNIKEALKKSVKNCIRLQIGGSAEENVGAARFGGRPDVPAGFEWAGFKGKPLSFLAQFDMEEISRYDSEGLLPETGLLSFFFELSASPTRYDEANRDSARVYWFEDKTTLHTADFPDDMAEYKRLPPLKISARPEKSYQSYPDFLLQRPKMVEEWDEFDKIREKLTAELPEYCEDGGMSKLLGWADPVRGNMTMKLELATRGYDVNDEALKVTAQDAQESEQWANRDQILLLQLECEPRGKFPIPSGSAGRLYFYIYRPDLEKRDFSNVRVVLQS